MRRGDLNGGYGTCLHTNIAADASVVEQVEEQQEQQQQEQEQQEQEQE